MNNSNEKILRDAITTVVNDIDAGDPITFGNKTYRFDFVHFEPDSNFHTYNVYRKFLWLWIPIFSVEQFTSDACEAECRNYIIDAFMRCIKC